MSRSQSGKGFDKTTVGCTKCGLCSGRRNVVLFRGSLPCDVFFIGEAPGESEDGMGYPFIGDAGRQLMDMWDEANVPLKGMWSYGISNILGCIPRSPSDIGTGELRTPHKEEAAACQPRLTSILEMANPKLIVLLGEIAKRFFPPVIKTINLPRWNGKPLHLVHPSKIVRTHQESPSAASLMEKKFVLALSESLKEI